MNIITLLNAREIKLSGPFPTGQLVLERLSFEEAVGQPFEIQLQVLSAVPWLDQEEFLGKTMTVELATTGDGPPRYFNGYIERLAQSGAAGDNTRFSFSLRPWLWLLRHSSSSRIFQKKTALQAIEQIFAEHGFSFVTNLSGSFREWEYLVQYRESDFNFVSRLLEQEGIYYYFTHDAEKHTLVLADPPNTAAALPGYEAVPLYPPGEGQQRKRDHLDSWAHSWRVVPGGYVSRDFDFRNPRGDLEVVLDASRAHPHGQFQIYDHPGEYLHREEGEQHVRKQIEAQQAPHALVEATGTARGLTAGSVFQPIDHNFGGAGTDPLKKYMILQAKYAITVNSYASSASASEVDCRCSIVALDSEVPYRTPALTAKPMVGGPQTATVVGKAGEEIWTDTYGRVKIQFHWDREGKADENSSCWVRVSQAWAGNRWGSIHIPRIGQEVIVDFLEGDPDRPIITGRVYNGDNMPPHDLPEHKTRSGIKSRSTKGGVPANFNEIRFEDRKGAEELFMQAERDLAILVKHDETREVGHDRIKVVQNHETVQIGVNRTETVGGDELITIHGNRREEVDSDETLAVTGRRARTVTGDETVSIGGNRSEEVTRDHSVTIAGNRSLSVGRDQTITVTGKRRQSVGKDEVLEVGKRLTIDAGDEIVVKTGAASITLQKNGDIVIKGKNITLDGSANVNARASRNVILSGSKITQN